MRKKILITGSSGHSGHQIAQLLSQDYDVIGMDLIQGTFTNHLNSLTDKDFIGRITEGIDVIIHTASLHAPHIATHTRQDFIDTNVIGTLNLLEAAEKNGVQKLIYTSTTSLYGESMSDEEQAVWVTEELPTVPRDIYDITKIAAEGLCKDFFNQNTLQTTVLRVSRFWNEPLEKKVFYRMYRGLDVRDVAAAHLLAVKKQFSQFEIFNISAQSIFTLEDLWDLRHNTTALLQVKIPALFDFYKRHDWEMPTMIDRVYVIDKAKKELGYEPKYNIDYLLRTI